MTSPQPSPRKLAKASLRGERQSEGGLPGQDRLSIIASLNGRGRHREAGPALKTQPRPRLRRAYRQPPRNSRQLS